MLEKNNSQRALRMIWSYSRDFAQLPHSVWCTFLPVIVLFDAQHTVFYPNCENCFSDFNLGWNTKVLKSIKCE